MRDIRSWSLAAAAALCLAACGGGDPDVPGSQGPSGAPTTAGNFTAVVAFGDSLTDVGTYEPATSLAGNGTAPYLGGKFTTNLDTGEAIWVENLATSLGLLVTPAQVGFAGNSVDCPAALANAALAGTCTGYAQGGSRVTDANGIGKTGGALTVPVVTQIAQHLERFNAFEDTDLILVWAGSNDVLLQFEAFAVTAAQVQAAVAGGTMTADQANSTLFQAQTAAQAEVKKAALELATYVRTQILANGGKYVAVINLPDIGDTPRGLSIPIPARTVLTDLSHLFNLWLNDGLTGQPVRIIDFFTLYKEKSAALAAQGYNTTTAACDVDKISAVTSGAVDDGSSLFCNATPGVPYNGLRAEANIDTWLFADGIHPTTAGHRAISDMFTEQLRSFGWVQ
jgi:phospholipase/lecithinase/hemolysin